MTEWAYEWFDPHAEKARADREARRADSAYGEGRRAVEATIARAAQNHLAEKIEIAIGRLAEKIALQIARELGGKMGHDYAAQREGARMAEHFRKACMDVVSGLDLPKQARMRATVNWSALSVVEDLTLEYEVLRPLHIAYRMEL